MGLILHIGREKIEEYRMSKFELNGNELIMRNIITGTLMIFADSKDKKLIPRKELLKVKRYLTEHKRKVR